MRAVNLIPVEERRGGSGAAGKSGGAVYGVLAVLGLLVVLASGWAVANKSVKDNTAELARINTEVQAAEARAGELAPYTQFASLRAKRVETVRQLASSRFDWGHALREVARTIPDNAWLTSLNGTVAPGAGSGGGSGGGAGGLRSAMAAPAIEVVGCTTSQRSVAKVLAAMRQIDGVQRVALSSSEKVAGTSGAGGGGSSNSGGDCRNGNTNFPQFELVVFFSAPNAPSAGASATPASTAPAATPAAGASSPTPASTDSGSTK